VKELRKRLIFALIFILSVILGGSAGYMLIEGWSCLDSLYMAIITVSTVGYREVHDLSPNGRMFTIFLIIGGVGSVLYALTAGARVVLEGELQEIIGRKRLEKKIKELRDHYIICGYGRMGKIIGRELKEKDIKFIVVEKKPDILEEKEDILILEPDATKDEVLKEAG
jgi:voltage-gated potassium channel